MALKHKISATEFTAMPELLQKEYKLQADMTYQLDLGDGLFVTDKDPSNLMSALENEREETKKAKAAADRLEAEKKAAELAGLTSVEEIKAHYDKQFKDMEKRRLDEQKAIEKQRLEQQQSAAESVRKQKALEVASSLFGTNAPLMLPHIEMALKAVPGETPKVEIVDSSTGLPAIDQNFDNWKKTLSTNPLFAPMIVVSNASGGSANGGKSSGVPVGTNADGKPKTYDDYKPAELLALKQSNPEQFQSLKSQKG